MADEEYYRVIVDEAYLELHTGPGRGYPVFHVVDRGMEVEVTQTTDRLVHGPYGVKARKAGRSGLKWN